VNGGHPFAGAQMALLPSQAAAADRRLIVPQPVTAVRLNEQSATLDIRALKHYPPGDEGGVGGRKRYAAGGQIPFALASAIALYEHLNRNYRPREGLRRDDTNRKHVPKDVTAVCQEHLATFRAYLLHRASYG